MAPFSALTHATLPPGWIVEPLGDGSLRVMLTDKARQETRPSMMPVAVLWNIVTLLLLVGNWGTGNYGGTVLFGLIGLMLTYSIVGEDPISVEWIVSSNRLEYRWGRLSSTRRKSRCYTDGAWKLTETTYESGRIKSWNLCFDCSKGWLKGGQIWHTDFYPQCTYEQLHYLAVIVSEKTGWTLNFQQRLEPKTRGGGGGGGP